MPTHRSPARRHRPSRPDLTEFPCKEHPEVQARPEVRIERDDADQTGRVHFIQVEC